MVRILVVLALVGLWQADLYAAGSESKPPTEEQLQAEAVKHYNKGLKHRDKAWEYEKKMAGEKDRKKRKKHQEAAQKEYRRAIQAYLKATEKDSGFHEAFGSLGYAYRKTGDYKRALEAYNRALALKSDYSEAIQYRGEAYLGLNRIEEARVAYSQLAGLNREHAAELLKAIKKWAERYRNMPDEGVSAEVVEETERWVRNKENAARASRKKTEVW